MAMAGQVNTDLTTALQNEGVNALGLSGVDGGLLTGPRKSAVRVIEDGKKKIMEAYLNQNFYGNRSYGVAAAAQSYWKKDLKDLTLAQMALLAAIPQSPTKFDLVKNAVEEDVEVEGNAQDDFGAADDTRR